jgi:hypothetical protein
MPVPIPTVASAVFPLVHDPPTDTSLKVVVSPAHTLLLPVIPGGSGFTVIGVVTSQPTPSEYVIVAVPTFTPLTTPVPEPTLAITTLLLLQVPPVSASLSVVVLPIHTCIVPVIADGSEVTVIVFIAAQPVVSV